MIMRHEKEVQVWWADVLELPVHARLPFTGPRCSRPSLNRATQSSWKGACGTIWTKSSPNTDENLSWLKNNSLLTHRCYHYTLTIFFP